MEKTLVTTIRVALALALAVPFVVMAGALPDTLYPHTLGKALYFRLLVELAFAAWLYLIIRYPAYRLPRSWLLVALVAYLLVTLVASFTGVSLSRSIWSTYERMQGWVSLAHYTAFALMLASVLRSFGHWWVMLNINLLAGFVVGLLGIYEIATGGPERMSLTFGNPTFLASYTLVNAFIAGAFLAHSLAARGEARTGEPDSLPNVLSPALMRSFWVVVLCLNLLVLDQTGTRGAVIGLAAGLALILLACVFRGGNRAFRMACLSAVIVIPALVAVPFLLRDNPIVASIGHVSPTLGRLIAATPEHPSVRSRILAAGIGIEAFAARPILGWGPENYYAAYDSYTDGEAAMNLEGFDQAHNRIVEELTTTGGIGLAAYLALWLCIGWLFVAKIRRLPLDARLFTIVIGSGFVGYFVQNLFLFDTPAPTVQLYLLIGFALYLGRVPVASAFDTDRTHQTTARPLGGILGRIETAVTRTTMSQAAVAVVIGILALWFCYLLVVSPYIGARNTFVLLTGARTTVERFDAYNTAISASPGLANETVRRFVSFVTDHRDELSDDERATALEIARRDVEAGIRREPKDWRLHLVLAQLYNRSSEDDPELIGLARQHTDAATAIAPGRVQVLQLKVQQHFYEGNNEAAIDLIDRYFEQAESYIEKDTDTYWRLYAMRDAIAEQQ